MPASPVGRGAPGVRECDGDTPGGSWRGEEPYAFGVAGTRIEEVRESAERHERATRVVCALTAAWQLRRSAKVGVSREEAHEETRLHAANRSILHAEASFITPAHDAIEWQWLVRDEPQDDHNRFAHAG